VVHARRARIIAFCNAGIATCRTSRQTEAENPIHYGGLRWHDTCSRTSVDPTAFDYETGRIYTERIGVGRSLP